MDSRLDERFGNGRACGTIATSVHCLDLLRHWDRRIQTDPASFLLTAATVYFVLWACAPAISTPTVVPLGRDRHNITVAASAGTTATAGDTITGSGDRLLAVDGQLSYYRQIRKSFDIGGIMAGGSGSLLAGGLMLRPRLQGEEGAAGVQLEAGFPWLGAQVPVAFRLHERVWLQASAGVRWPYIYGRLLVPTAIGTTIRVTDRVDFVVQADARVDPDQPDMSILTGTFGVSTRFGRKRARKQERSAPKVPPTPPEEPERLSPTDGPQAPDAAPSVDDAAPAGRQPDSEDVPGATLSHVVPARRIPADAPARSSPPPMAVPWPD